MWVSSLELREGVVLFVTAAIPEFLRAISRHDLAAKVLDL